MNTRNGKVLEGCPELTHKFYVRFDWGKALLTVVACISSVGFFALVLYWYETLYFQSFYSEEPDIESAEYVGFTTDIGQTIYCKLYTREIRLCRLEEPRTRILFNQGVHKFFYEKTEDRFLNVGRVIQRSFKERLAEDPNFYRNYRPNTQADVDELKSFYGLNRIRLSHEPLLLSILKSLLMPLNTYEIFAALVCFYFNLAYFGFQLVFYIIIQSIAKILGDRAKVDKVNDIADKQAISRVIRLGADDRRALVKIPSDEVAVGDLIVVSPNDSLTCDITLIGGSCNMNETVLTGETTPVLKQPVVPGQPVGDDNMLYAGSECLTISGSDFAVGVVSGTGWNTFKGSLLDDMINTPSLMFKFDKDFLVVCFTLLFIYLVINTYVIYNEFARGNITWDMVIFRVVLIVMTAFSPSAMVTFTILNVIVERRLRQQSVSVMVSERIKQTGRVKVLGFDKTGTLTDDFVKVAGVLVTDQEHRTLSDFHSDLSDIGKDARARNVIEFFATCNNLIKVRGDIEGDKIDVQQFRESGFEFKSVGDDAAVTSVREVAEVDRVVSDNLRAGHDDVSQLGRSDVSDNSGDRLARRSVKPALIPSQNFRETFGLRENAEYKIKKIFTFTPERKRMSVVIARPDSNDRLVFCKGAPEVIVKLCRPETIPTDFEAKALDFTMKGFRILGFGYRTAEKEETLATPTEAEKDLHFLGFLLLQNNLKPNTKETITQLQNCDIQVLMITGDNVYTGINAALGCGMIDQDQKVYIGQAGENNKIKWHIMSREEMLRSLRFLHSDRHTQIAMMNENLAKIQPRGSVTGPKPQRIQDELMMATVRKGLIEILNDCDENNAVIVLEGDAFDFVMKKFANSEDVQERFLAHTRVYGRAKPLQKQQIIRALKKKHLKNSVTVGFVGDGSNDSNALKEANMGLCIGSKEAAITASFSSSVNDISAVIPVLCLGRFTLESLLQVMKIALYSGFISSMVFTLVSAYGLTFTNSDVLSDRMLFLSIYVVNCLTWHREKLMPFLPKAGFINRNTITEVGVAWAAGICYITIAFVILITRYEWKSPMQIVYTLRGIDYEEHFFVEAKYLLAMFTINDLIMATAFHRSIPFKKPFFTNPFFLLLYVVYLGFHTLPFYVEYLFPAPMERRFNDFRKFPLVDDDLWLKALSFAFLASMGVYFLIKLIQNYQIELSLERRARLLKRQEEALSVVN